MRSPTRCSTTIPASPIPSCTPTREGPRWSASWSGRSPSSAPTGSSLVDCRPTTPGSTRRTVPWPTSWPARASPIAPSRPAPRSGTARLSATSRPSSESGASGSATAPQSIERRRCHTGCATTTTTDATARSGTGRRSVAFGRSQGRTQIQPLGLLALRVVRSFHLALVILGRSLPPNGDRVVTPSSVELLVVP